MQRFARSLCPLCRKFVPLAACLATLSLVAAAPVTAQAVERSAGQTCVFEGADGPGHGRRIVFLAGDEEYRSEEALVQLAKILAQRHGFHCTVLFALDEATGTIDPNASHSLVGAEALDSADAIVMGLRFREYPDETMKHFVDAYLAGKPIVALRTSTHAFKYSSDSKSRFREYSYDSKQWPGGFGRQVLGETWVTHLGKNHAEATRGLLEPAAKDHPVLRGVGEIFADTGAYVAHPPEDATILIRGQVLAGTTATSPPLEGEKNNPLQPVAWTRVHRNAAGKTNRILCTTMGAATDLLDENLRRMLVNGIYWTLGDEVPARADVAIVGDYQPSDYSFGGFRPGVHPADLQLVSTNVASDNNLLPFSLQTGERIALVGGVLPPRMALYGHFETMLHTRFPEKKLRVRNFGWPTDQAGDQQRPNDYTALDDPMKVFGPTVLICFFGGNESFAGPAGIENFKQGLQAYVESKGPYLAHDGQRPRFVFVSPTAFENPANHSLPDGSAENANLQLYRDAMRETAEKLGLPFVDLFAPTAKLFAQADGAQFTINGFHVNEAGAQVAAQHLDRALFGSDQQSKPVDSTQYEKLRTAVIDKMWHHQNDYRMLNGWYVYGGRNTPFGVVNFPAEFVKLRKMVAVRDLRLWDIAQGKTVSYQADDGSTGDLSKVKTTFGTKEYSEPDELRFLSPQEAEKAMEVAPGYRLQTFASEEMFPELANPVQMNFDNRGRLWVSCMPTYPQWRPGDPKPNDRLLIFEDTDKDGVADDVKVFVDDLHCPVGFEFYNGGVLVVSQPRILFLKDTDGDDRADVREVFYDGFASDDTHHAICSFEWTPGGELIMLEGISMLTSIETPWGPFRNRNKSVAYRLDPRTWKINRHMTPCYANPWCYTHNDWGQGFVGDGTGANQHWATPLTGKTYNGRGGTKQFISYEGQRMRPAGGNEFVSSRQFPDDSQGNFLYSCVINTNAILQFTVEEQGSGYAGKRITDLVRSSDDNFRPMAPKFGADGALYFADWHNPLIGHMQYSQRDPNRDHRHGRIYRLTAEGRPPLKPVTQAGKSIPELLEQLRQVELRTRYRVRRELRDRNTAEVLNTIKSWSAGIKKTDPLHDRLLTEALWVEQGHHAVDPHLLQRVMQAQTPNARAAAAHVIGGEFTAHPEAVAWLKTLIHDSHPRVRLEALRALSFVGTPAAVEVALEVVDHDLDYYLDYTLMSTLGALKPVIAAELAKGTPLAADRPLAKTYLDKVIHGSAYGAKAHLLLATLSDQPAPNDADKQRLMAKLAELRGNADVGGKVFQRTCVACHKIGDIGAKFGPNLSDVGLRLKRVETVLSVLEPNAKLDPKYQTVVVVTDEGKAYSGLVAEETPETLTMMIGAGKLQEIPQDSIEERNNVSVSSMPERLHESMSAKEFVDLLEYLAKQKNKPEQP